ncbi:MAG: DMT family transporter [Phycisphaerales bacterium]|nr:MAG: DMT family transporter [Phycisphaerales bacterium]
MRKVYVKLWLTALFWGGAFVAGKHVSQHLGPCGIAFLRFATASVLLLVLTRWQEGRWPRLNAAQTVSIALLGATGIFSYNIMFFKGLSLIEAGRASLIIATTPAFIALSSALFLRERLGPVRIAGIFLSVAGAVVVVSRGSFQWGSSDVLGVGELLILGCVLSWVAYSLIGKIVMRGLSPLVAVTYSVVVGTAALFVSTCLEGLSENVSRASLLDWLAILYMAVFATVIGFVWFYEGVKRVGATRAGLLINLVPIFAVLLAFLLLKEPITASLGVGAAMVVSGVYLTNQIPPPSRDATTTPAREMSPQRTPVRR